MKENKYKPAADQAISDDDLENVTGGIAPNYQSKIHSVISKLEIHDPDKDDLQKQPQVIGTGLPSF